MISLSAMGGKLCSFLGCGLPSRTKRLILVTSLTARVKNDPDLDRATLKRLNELLDLCSSENAMRLPAHLSSVIWNGESVASIQPALVGKEQIADKKVSELVLYFKQSIPLWLRYDDAEVESDLRQLFRNHNGVFN